MIKEQRAKGLVQKILDLSYDFETRRCHFDRIDKRNREIEIWMYRCELNQLLGLARPEIHTL